MLAVFFSIFVHPILKMRVLFIIIAIKLNLFYFTKADRGRQADRSSSKVLTLAETAYFPILGRPMGTRHGPYRRLC